jgi:hypothetical protein
MKRHFRRWGLLYFLVTLACAVEGTSAWLYWYVNTWPSQDDVPWGWAWAADAVTNLQSEFWSILIAAYLVNAYRSQRFWFQEGEKDE